DIKNGNRRKTARNVLPFHHPLPVLFAGAERPHEHGQRSGSACSIQRLPVGPIFVQRSLFDENRRSSRKKPAAPRLSSLFAGRSAHPQEKRLSLEHGSGV